MQLHFCQFFPNPLCILGRPLTRHVMRVVEILRDIPWKV